MKASAWSRGGGTFGIRVGIPNRNAHFDPGWSEIQVEIDGQIHRFAITKGFWNKCPEFRDSGSTVIQDWLQQHFTLDWPSGQPPRFQLVPLGDAKFRLIG